MEIRFLMVVGFGMKSGGYPQGFHKRNLCHEIWDINDWVDITIGSSEWVPWTVMIHQLKIR
jgi:hypothetical protein